MARHALSSISLLALASGIAARQIHSTTTPAGWKVVERADASADITLRLTLPSADITLLHDALEAVSTPGHARYGKHLSREEAGALAAPTKEVAAAVEAWLAEFDVKASASAGGEVLRIKTSVGVAEKLLAPAEYYLFSDGHDSATTMRTLDWGVPDGLDIESAHPTNLFPVASRTDAFVGQEPGSPAPLKSHPAGNSSSCAGSFSPACIRSQYGLGDYQFTAKSNAITIFGEAAHYPKASLKAYMQKYNPDHVDQTFTIGSADGGAGQNGGSGVGEELALDLDTIAGVTAPLPITLVDAPVVAYKDFATDISDLVDYLLNLTNPPPVTSISYGGVESELFGVSNLPIQVCNGIAQLGARGVSVLSSSGDDGVNCESKNGAFDALFPASCPYITAVGATREIPEKTTHWSGGGFSAHFAQPAYQTKAVSAYLAKHGKAHKGQYNQSGRAFPDVAAYGVNFPIYFEGGFTSVGGTSASCPTVASIIAALNDVRLNNGDAVLGFLNPWIYGQTSDAWTDITDGNTASSCGAGFKADVGWDPTTGFGTPNFQKLKALLP